MPAYPAHDWMRTEHADLMPLPERALPKPPTSLVLSGELKDQESCLGVYTLVEDFSANGCPVWQHSSRDRYIAKYRNGTHTEQSSLIAIW